MKNYTVKVADSKADFFEELLTSLHFVNFHEMSSENAVHEAPVSAEASIRAVAERVKDNREHDITRLREIMDNIDKQRTHN